MNFKDFSNTREKVQFLLNTIPQTRDSDSFLIAVYWRQELGDEVDIPTREFLKDYLSKEKMTSPESIRRLRQILQKEDPLLRGESYRKRQKLGEELKTKFAGE